MFWFIDNDFLSTKTEGSGWNSSYTISTLLLQVQAFLSDPDLPENLLPNDSKIEELMKSMKNYERIFNIDNYKKVIKHTWNNPYPEMYFKSENNKNIE